MPLHVRPQTPQLEGSKSRLVQPTATPQKVSPNDAQRHCVPSQYWSLTQTSPHAAQFIESIRTQRPPHSLVPPGQEHLAPSQTWSPRQVTPHAPQFAVLLGKQTSRQMRPSQRHEVAEHVSPSRQALPHRPQLSALE